MTTKPILTLPCIAAASILAIGCVFSSVGRVAESQTTSAIAAVQSATPSRKLLDDGLASDFRKSTERYMQLHEKIQRQGTRPGPAAGIGENLVSRQALATRLRFARHDARPGDLFTPRIAMAFRRAMDPELRGLAAVGARDTIREDAPEMFVLVVNGDYPEGASRSTMPATVLKILPQLPKGLEYRIVGTHLLLIDLDANIVVDYMLDVMCKSC